MQLDSHGGGSQVFSITRVDFCLSSVNARTWVAPRKIPAQKRPDFVIFVKEGTSDVEAGDDHLTDGVVPAGGQSGLSPLEDLCAAVDCSAIRWKRQCLSQKETGQS